MFSTKENFTLYSYYRNNKWTDKAIKCIWQPIWVHSCINCSIPNDLRNDVRMFNYAYSLVAQASLTVWEQGSVHCFTMRDLFICLLFLFRQWGDAEITTRINCLYTVKTNTKLWLRDENWSMSKLTTRQFVFCSSYYTSIATGSLSLFAWKKSSIIKRKWGLG
jgi:hypothetical protein